MCVIIYKPAESEMLRKKVYKRCFDANTDGGGFAWWDTEAETWQVQKGFMTFKKWWKAFNLHNFQVSDIVIVHFRIGTSGNRKGPDCTHPFPITEDLEEMQALEYSSDNVVFHNGVIGLGQEEYSDTMIGIIDYVVPLWKHIEEKGISEILGEVLEDSRCRWIITEKDTVYMYGKWEEDTKYPGYYFSNDGYKPVKVYNYGNDDSYYGSNWNTHTATRCTTIRYFRTTSDASDFQNAGGVWAWALWDEFMRKERLDLADAYSNTVKEEVIISKKDVQRAQREVQAIISPCEKTVQADFPITITGLLDNNGDIIWDSQYDMDLDIPCCPSCGGDDLTDSEMMIGDSACTSCGAVFQMSTGKVLLLDTNVIISNKYRECPVCKTIVKLNEWGECPECEHIIDSDITETMLKQQKEVS